MEKRTCKRCGKEFITAYDNELYCDDCQELEVERQQEEDALNWQFEMNYGSDYINEALEDDDDE